MREWQNRERDIYEDANKDWGANKILIAPDARVVSSKNLFPYKIFQRFLFELRIKSWELFGILTILKSSFR